MGMKYHYSSYCGTWSRVLGRMDFYTVEVDLTPVNGDRGDWGRVKGVWIRAHCTSRDRRDVDDHILPSDVWNWLGDRVGAEARHRLVTEDFLSQIDWRKYDEAKNGGCAFDRCKAPPHSRGRLSVIRH